MKRFISVSVRRTVRAKRPVQGPPIGSALKYVGIVLSFILPLLLAQSDAKAAEAQAAASTKQAGAGAPAGKAGLQSKEDGAVFYVGAGRGAGAPAGKAGLQSFVQTLPGSVVKIDMVAVPAGSLTAAGQKVAIKPYWIASTETVWEAFDVFLASGPPSPAYDQTAFAPDAIARPSKSYILPDLGWGHHGYPVINVSYLSAQMFCRWLSDKTGKKYRLPTEAEWEYAARAGTAATKPLAPAQLGKIAWYAANSESLTHPVAKKLPNTWKLYDMQGNVGEWATDKDGKPVLCGATFRDKADKITPTERKHWSPAWQETDPQLPKSRWWLSDGSFVGFRIVCEPSLN